MAEPRLASRPYAFAARTVFGARLRGSQETIMPRCIYWFGIWEPPLTRWLQETLRPGDVFVDVGANLGYFSLLAARAVGPRGHVVALEPSPAVFARLEENLALNGFANVRAIEAAAGAEESRAPLYRAAWNDAESSTLPLPGLEYDRDVRVAPLPALLTREELERVRVIKIDVEGGEADVVGGLVPALERLRTDAEIVAEVHPHLLARAGRSVGDLLAMVEPAGFVAYALPVDFSARAHLEPRESLRPVRCTEPPDDLVHLILSRRRAAHP